MAATDAQVLYSVGPFAGMKVMPGVFNPVNPYNQGNPVSGASVSNIDVHVNKFAATTSFGRLPFVQFAALGTIVSLVRYDVGPNRPFWIAQDASGQTSFYDLNNQLIFDLGDFGSTWTQGVECDGDVFLNNGQQIYVARDNSYPGSPKQTLAFAQWQYPPFSGTPVLTKFSNVPGLQQQEYFYAFTVVTFIPTINGNIAQESAPVGADAPYPYHKTVTDDNTAIQISGLGGGFNADGLEFKIRIYRLSTKQPNWFEVVTLTDPTYVDTNSDQDISGNKQIAFSGQVPPVSPTALWPIAEYLDRMWVFALVQGKVTQGQPQAQLWYSNQGQAWNFDDEAQVLLVGNELTTPGQPSGSQPDGLPVYGSQPVAMQKFGSLLTLWRPFDSWFVTGQDQNTFQVITLFDSVGCIAPQGIIVGRGIMAWPADGNAYWTWDGSSLNYISDDVWLLLNGIGPENQTDQVGFYWQNFFCWSFPSQNKTIRWHAPTQQWDMIPYALNTVTTLRSQNADASGVTFPWFNQVVGSRVTAGVIPTPPPGPNCIDSWFADPVFDLENPVNAVWTGPVSDMGSASTTKTLRYVVVEGPPQPGATLGITINRDLGQLPPIDLAPFDLGSPYPWIITIDQSDSQCTLADMTLRWNSSSGAAVQLWKVELYGAPDHRPFAKKV